MTLEPEEFRPLIGHTIRRIRGEQPRQGPTVRLNYALAQEARARRNALPSSAALAGRLGNGA